MALPYIQMAAIQMAAILMAPMQMAPIQMASIQMASIQMASIKMASNQMAPIRMAEASICYLLDSCSNVVHLKRKQWLTYTSPSWALASGRRRCLGPGLGLVERVA